jgi:hypothetical protein
VDPTIQNQREVIEEQRETIQSLQEQVNNLVTVLAHENTPAR